AVSDPAGCEPCAAESARSGRNRPSGTAPASRLRACSTRSPLRATTSSCSRYSAPFPLPCSPLDFRGFGGWPNTTRGRGTAGGVEGSIGVFTSPVSRDSPMLPGLTVPASLAGVLQVLRGSVTAPAVAPFRLVVVGMVAQTGPRAVCGMRLGAGLQTVVSHHRLHRFFSVNRWSADALGLVLARLVVERLLPAGAALEVAVDDTLFRRRGKQVHAAFWTHDASQPGRVTARGNRGGVGGLVVRLPFCARPTCLPVLFRLWGGKGSATPVELARTLVGLLARAFPDRVIHVVADAAYHGRPLRDLPERVTFTTRVQRNAVLYAPAPPPTGRGGRPRTRGDRIGNPTQAGAGASWRQTSVTRYGRTDTVAVAEV